MQTTITCSEVLTIPDLTRKWGWFTRSRTILPSQQLDVCELPHRHQYVCPVLPGLESLVFSFGCAGIMYLQAPMALGRQESFTAEETYNYTYVIKKSTCLPAQSWVREIKAIGFLLAQDWFFSWHSVLLLHLCHLLVVDCPSYPVLTPSKEVSGICQFW